MTPKEKAQKLVGKFNNEHIEDTFVIYQNVDESKRCALIAVDEILLYLKNSDDVMTSIKAVDYWQEVKKEIEKL
jgi:predicted esterase YcpF (UPF0227 family)